MITTAVIKNPNHIKTEFKKERQRGLDAAKNAIYHESLRLKTLLRQEIKAGAPGGRTMDPLGAMALAGKKGSGSGKPLTRIAFMMKFFVFKKGSTWFAKLGYVPKAGGGYGPKGSKISWGKILEKHATGFSLSVTPRMRKKFISMAMPSLGRWTGGETTKSGSWTKGGRSGGRVYVAKAASKSRSGAKTWEYKKRSSGSWQKSGRSGGRVFVAREASPYFLKKDSRFRIPSRPFIEPFWTARKSEAKQNMKQIFRQGMKDKVLNSF